MKLPHCVKSLVLKTTHAGGYKEAKLALASDQIRRRKLNLFAGRIYRLKTHLLWVGP